MKNTLPFLLIVFIATFACSQISLMSKDRKQSQVEEEIWALEEAYNSYHRDANHEGILSIWHDKLLGWPDTESQPIDKNAGARYLERQFPEPGLWTFEIERSGIRVLGDVVINHYIVHTFWKDAAGVDQKQSTRITHTWIKEASKWKILGGMSNNSKTVIPRTFFNRCLKLTG